MSVVWQQSTHGVLRRQRRTQQMLAYLLITVVIVATLLGSVYLALLAANVRLCREAWALEHELVAVQRENQALYTEIAQVSSIPVLQERSTALHYRPAEQIDYMFIGEP